RRFRVGDPGIQYIDALAGATLDRMAAAEKYAKKGEVVATSEVVSALAGEVEATPVAEDDRRRTIDDGIESSIVHRPSSIVTEGYYVIRRLLMQVPQDPWPHLPDG